MKRPKIKSIVIPLCLVIFIGIGLFHLAVYDVDAMIDWAVKAMLILVVVSL